MTHIKWILVSFVIILSSCEGPFVFEARSEVDLSQISEGKVFISTQVGTNSLFANTETGEVLNVPTPNQGGGASVDLVNEVIYGTNSSGKLYKAAIEDWKWEFTGDSLGFQITLTQISPDGKRLYFGDFGSAFPSLKFLNLEEGFTTTVGTNLSFTPFAINPVGGKLATVIDGRGIELNAIFLIDPEDGSQVRLVTGKDISSDPNFIISTSFIGLKWYPDGNKLAFWDFAESKLGIIDIATRNLSYIDLGGELFNPSFAFSPDLSQLIFSNDQDLFVADWQDGPTPSVSNIQLWLNLRETTAVERSFADNVVQIFWWR